MRYHEIKPTAALSRYVECFWTLENEASTEPAQPERILPDGCVELILNFGTRFREHREDGREEIQPRHFLVGQMTRPMLITANGRVGLIGIRFHPGGTLPFFRIPMNELTNQVTELNALAWDLEGEFVAKVGEAQLMAQKVATLQELLANRVKANHESWTLGLAAKIVSRYGRVTIDELALDAGISSRQLERRFLREVGVGPKLLCRILRFQQVFRAIDRKDAGWAGVAADCGYYDQAHLIRDFQQFAGQAPSVLLAEASSLTQSFTRKERMSHFSNTSTTNVYRVSV